MTWSDEKTESAHAGSISGSIGATRPENTDELSRHCPEGDDLTALQTWMAELIVHRRRLSKSPALSETAARHFRGSPDLTPVDQIDIYRQQFWLRHTSSLIEDFRGLTTILGQKEWERVVESYLCAHPLDARRLGELGRLLPQHLQTIDDLPHRRLCVDMARLEWAYLQSFEAADDPPLDPQRLQAMGEADWPTAQIVLSSSLHLLDVEYPVAKLRRSLLRKSPDEPAVELPKDPRPHYLVVYRRQGRLYDKRVSRSAFLLLRALSEGKKLIPACEAAIAQHPDAQRVFEEQLMSWFALWGRLGWVVDVHPSNQKTSNG